MTRLFPTAVIVSLTFLAGTLAAQQVEVGEKVALNMFDAEASYVFESDLNHGGSFGKQDESNFSFQFAHRIHWKDTLYFRVAASYERFEFGETAAPVPETLQRYAVTIGVDYMKGADLGALLWFSPGIYTEKDSRWDAFDCPITLARFWVLQPDKLYLLTGANYSFLRGGWGVIPAAGLVWFPADHWKVLAIPPKPKIVYAPNENCELWVGGEIKGGAFRTDRHPEYVGPDVAKLSGTQVDYTDYRAGAGFNYDLNDHFSFGLSGGCAVQRAFKFHRAGENYRTDPAPYFKVELSAKF